MPMQKFLKAVKMIILKMKNCDIFLIFAQNIDRWHRITEAVLMSTHNLCFRAKIRKEMAELSRLRRPCGHAMLTNSWACHNVW